MADVALLTADVSLEPVDSDCSATALISAENWHTPVQKLLPANDSVGSLKWFSP